LFDAIYTGVLDVVGQALGIANLLLLVVAAAFCLPSLLAQFTQQSLKNRVQVLLKKKV